MTSKPKDYKYVPMFYVINQQHYTPTSYMSPTSLSTLPPLASRVFQGNRHVALMIYFIRALGREPHGELCTKVFLMAQFASYPVESRAEPSSVRDLSFIHMNLVPSLACHGIRLLSLHVCRSTLVSMFHAIDRFSCGSFYTTSSFVTIHDMPLQCVHATCR